MEVVNLFQAWLKKPFDPEGDWLSWVLFLGFVSLVLIGWRRVINKIETTT